ncbi:DNA repair protein RAD51 homolog 2 [Polyodon spathula]|uniref:DNA repair protein RAD51 homolog 2 n=1 Tax=Polyodon spathula TaxID=7913 RepID=UPI001B7EA94C|nr:DNA repair protein RAD51 homolog 2 [Polyodon spathula]
MANKKLRRTGMLPELCDRLDRHQIETCQDFLSLGPLELMREAGQSYQQVQTLLRTVSLACAPTMVTALELRDRRSRAFFPTSLRGLDVVLHGGLASGTLTEVTGPSGCGKSQFCMMLSVLATLPRSMGGLDSSVLYIDTESAFCAERLVEIAQNRFPKYFSLQERVVEMAQKIHLFRELTCQNVLKRLGGLEEEIISKKAGLVIIDSIASVVRKEFDTSIPGNLSERSSLLSQEAATLKYLAEEFSIPVVLTNQITTHLSRKGTAPSHLECNVPESEVSADGESGYVTAALGNTWSHSVNTRLIVQYLDSQRRQIIVAKSPIAPFSVFNYTVQNSGLELEDGEDQAGSSHQGTDPGLQPIRVRTAFNYCLTHTTPTSSQSTGCH